MPLSRHAKERNFSCNLFNSFLLMMTVSAHFHNGMPCPSERAKMGIRTGGDAQGNGRRWATERAEMPIRTGNLCRDKPVSICIFARSSRIVFPFCWCCSAAHFSNLFAATAVLRSARLPPAVPHIVRHKTKTTQGGSPRSSRKCLIHYDATLLAPHFIGKP